MIVLLNKKIVINFFRFKSKCVAVIAYRYKIAIIYMKTVYIFFDNNITELIIIINILSIFIGAKCRRIRYNYTCPTGTLHSCLIIYSY